MLELKKMDHAPLVGEGSVCFSKDQTTLYGANQNLVGSIEFSDKKFKNLRKINLAGNRLTSIVLNNINNLIHLLIFGNYINKLDISCNSKLILLDVWSNNITSFSVSKNSSLKFLYIPGNPLKEFIVSEEQIKNLKDPESGYYWELDFPNSKWTITK